MEDDWMPQAACRILRIDNRLFFQVIGRHEHITTSAKSVCSMCKVSDQCLEYALTNNIRDGIWGGKTRDERKAIRRTRIMFGQAS